MSFQGNSQDASLSHVSLPVYAGLTGYYVEEDEKAEVYSIVFV